MGSIISDYEVTSDILYDIAHQNDEREYCWACGVTHDLPTGRDCPDYDLPVNREARAYWRGWNDAYQQFAARGAEEIGDAIAIGQAKSRIERVLEDAERRRAIGEEAEAV